MITRHYHFANQYKHFFLTGIHTIDLPHNNLVINVFYRYYIQPFTNHLPIDRIICFFYVTINQHFKILFVCVYIVLPFNNNL